MHKIAELLPITFVVLWLLRRTRVSRALRKSTDRTTWAQASDLRPARYPKSRNPFTSKRGLK